MGAAILMSPTIDVGLNSYDPYACIGGLISLRPGSGVVNYGTIVSVNLILTNSDVFTGNLLLYFFSDLPASSVADGSPVSFNENLDILGGMGILKVASTNWIVLEDSSTYRGVTVPTQIGMYWRVNANQDKPVIYMMVVSDSAETFASAGDGIFKIGVLMEFGKTPI